MDKSTTKSTKHFEKTSKDNKKINAPSASTKTASSLKLPLAGKPNVAGHRYVKIANDPHLAPSEARAKEHNFPKSLWNQFTTELDKKPEYETEIFLKFEFKGIDITQVNINHFDLGRQLDKNELLDQCYAAQQKLREELMNSPDFDEHKARRDPEDKYFAPYWGLRKGELVPKQTAYGNVILVLSFFSEPEFTSIVGKQTKDIREFNIHVSKYIHDKLYPKYAKYLTEHLTLIVSDNERAKLAAQPGLASIDSALIRLKISEQKKMGRLALVKLNFRISTLLNDKESLMEAVMSKNPFVKFLIGPDTSMDTRNFSAQGTSTAYGILEINADKVDNKLLYMGNMHEWQMTIVALSTE